jgi:hypothetical protein
MKLTVKNIRKAMEQLETCPFCENELELSVFTRKGEQGYFVKCFCPGCDSIRDFGEFLVELEKDGVKNE